MFRRPDNSNPNSMASRFRRRRFRLIESLIEELLTTRKRVRILDIGGRRDYWGLLSPELIPQVSVTLLNFEAELDIGATENDPLETTYLQGDGCNMPEFADRSFDLAHSNSVIEHVGSLHNMALYADELRRVGNAYFVQTPYLWFPIEPHYGLPFVHWLPGPTRARLLNRYKLGYGNKVKDYREALATADHTQIVDRTLLNILFPDGTLSKERFALMTKSLIVTRQPSWTSAKTR